MLGDYNAGNIKPNQVRVSPSSIAQLSDNEWLWYKNAILGDKTFNGNTSTRLGTLTHYMCEQWIKGIEQPSDESVIDWLERENESDQWRVLDNSKKLFECFAENYKYKSQTKSEVWLEFEPNDSVILSGTADLMLNNCILDIKTTGKLKASIGDYWTQLYLLAYIARQSGYEIDRVGIIYLIEPTKTIGARFVEIVEDIDEIKMDEFIYWLKSKLKKIKFAKDLGDDWEWVMSKNLLSFRQ